MEGIEVPDDFQHLLKKDGMTRNRDDYNSRKKNIVAFCTGGERSRESIEKAMGYKPHSGVTVLRELVNEHKLWKPSRGYYRAVEIDGQVAQTAEDTRRKATLSRVQQLAKDYMWLNSGADWYTLKKFVEYIEENGV